ncbi:hypothetical protein AOL_s00169g203 [Orbilia oligospora ATCC 24927]|uniref:F-box domain-containing protein n=2 Tax=Orbilia oligospora TaxID=2813651 RepID=G1XN00_ARTOA|nr:hypothetical protein AOL_s00169g203 [Orbilia oligospora ATCC 24927]EGX45597.1 hypothetical protein AOL_s00169g203 [Orbilia oligospora ATCC 24927]KAF3283317.1 hypothetical protein TWF970_001297 [Orbilia oligospora]
MEASGLSSLPLPPELILQVISSVDAFTVVYALRRTSRRLRTLSDVVYPTMHGLPVAAWIKVFSYLFATELSKLKKLSHSFNNLLNFLISRGRLPHTYYGQTPVSNDLINRIPRHQMLLHPFLRQIEFWHKHWRRFGGRKSIIAAPNLLFESPSLLPVDRILVGLYPNPRFQDSDTRYFNKVVLRKRRSSKIITNLDILVAVDEMLGQGINAACVQLRDGILCVSRTAQEFGKHIGKVYLGGVDEEIGFIDDLIYDGDFLASAGRSQWAFGNRVQYAGLNRRPGEWRVEDTWLVLSVRWIT